MLEIDGLQVRYGSTVVLEQLDWTVGTSGSVVTALLGPSGCGKSTLIRAVAGLEPSAAGTIRFDGEDIADVPTHRRDFGVVFQDGQLFGGRTVAANVAYGLRMRRWSRADISSRVEEMLDLVRLPDLGRRRVDELSGGQAQRVALARALAPRPRLLLLDEPLAALDRLLRDALATEIAEIVRAADTPTLVVTHDHTEAALMADTISVMRSGDIVQTATPGRLWARPVDEWTARFLGVTAVLAGRARNSHVDTDLGQIAMDVPDGDTLLGLRPESIHAIEPRSGRGNGSDTDRSGESTGTGVVGVVAAVADLPAGRRLRVRTAVGEFDAVTSAAVGVGDDVALRIVAERVAVIGA
ncbi:ABC transporter ATP-binding protein [Gordonia sp. OPL2]|uniref:ABC transporter ATP-binding protein n=1 Tax=Gordonia sp. OPL2 TaxID=2486274 RepID=UPI0016555F2A|nr:ABC transporter ATP-binding protein [Gordonia sp. OPL2]RPA12983.1 ABC transporter ATP-binding protein [Gordonia sp. OPL2]